MESISHLMNKVDDVLWRAFTGGFSAGYFNTVGSEETPAIHFLSIQTGIRRGLQNTAGLYGRQGRSTLGRQNLKLFDNTSSLSNPRHDALLSGLHVLQFDWHVLLTQMGWRLHTGVGPLVKDLPKSDVRPPGDNVGWPQTRTLRPRTRKRGLIMRNIVQGMQGAPELKSEELSSSTLDDEDVYRLMRQTETYDFRTGREGTCWSYHVVMSLWYCADHTQP
jgi:hypothetical protein